MKLPRKYLVLVLLLIISLTILTFAIPPLLYVPPSIDSVTILSYAGSKTFEIAVSLINQASLSAHIKEGSIIILNDKGEIGSIEINDIELPSKQTIKLNLFLKLNEGDALNEFMSQLLTKGNSTFYYYGKVKVSVPILSFLSIDVNIPKSSSIFSIGNPSTFFSVNKIVVNQNDTLANLTVNNPFNLTLTLAYFSGQLFYSGRSIGWLNYSGPLELSSYDQRSFSVPLALYTNELGGVVSELINNKDIALSWKGTVSLILGELDVNLNATFEKDIKFDFNINAIVNNISFEQQNKLIINANVSFMLSNSFDIYFKIKTFTFSVYAGNDKVGSGSIENLDVIKNPLNNINIVVDINPSSLPSLLGIFFSSKSLTLDIMDMSGIISVFGKDISMNSTRRVSIPVGYSSLGLNFGITVYSIQVAPDNKNLNVTLKLIVKAPNIKNLNLQLIDPSFLVYEPQTNTTLKIFSNSFTLSDESYNFVSILLNVNDPSTNKIFSLFATQGKVNFIVKNLNATLKFSNQLIPVFLSLSQKIEITPLGLVGVKVYAGLISSPNLGTFQITLNVTVNLKSEFPIQLYIYQVAYDVYSSDGSVLIAKNATLQPRQYENTVPIVILIGSGNKTFIADANITITQDGLKWIAQQALQSDFLNITVKNITVYLKLFSLPLKLYIPTYNIQAELYPRLKITITQFSFYPGKKAEVDAQVYSPNYKIPVSVTSLTFKLNDGSTLTYFANGTLLKTYSNINGSLLNGRFSILFVGQNPLNYIGPLIKGDTSLIYGTDVSAKVFIGDKQIDLFLFKTVFLRINSLIQIQTNATLLGFSLSQTSDGVEILGNGILNVTLKQGLNAPVNFRSATFIVNGVVGNNWIPIGSGKLITQGSFSGNFASLNLQASVKLTKSGFAYFGQYLISKGQVVVKLSNVTMHVSIYDIEGDIPFIDVYLPIQGPNLSISVTNVNVQSINWGTSGTSIVIKSVTVSADVVIKNPYNFTVTLSNIKVDVYHSSGNYLGRTVITQTITLAPLQTVIIQGVTIDIVNVSPLYSDLQTTIISFIPLKVQACISGTLIYAKGTAMATVYDISFNMNFVTPKVPVGSVCTIITF